MKEQFTQGDWVNDGRTVYALQDSLCPGMPSKENRFYFGVQGKCSDEELLANAVLAKAAPKMYEFLKRVHTLKDCDMDYAISWIMDNANDIGDLLAEARGENKESNEDLICTRCKKEVETYSEIVYSQGSKVCTDCKKETLEDDKRAFDRDMNLRCLRPFSDF